LVVAAWVSPATGDTGYQKPPEAIRKILDLPPSPTVSLAPRGDYLVLAQQQRYPSIADLARPIVRLGGLRIDPATNGTQRTPRIVSLALRPVHGDKDILLQLPEGARPGSPIWSPDGMRFAILNTTASSIEVLVGSPDQPRLRPVPDLRINGALGVPIRWLPDSKTILVQTISTGRAGPPTKPIAPSGPVIQESSGKPAPVRTYQDLLRNPHDEALFDHYCTSQLVLVDSTTLKTTPLGKPAVYSSARPSPDGNYLLVVRTRRPYSYVLPATGFPRTTEVWDATGKVVHKVAESTGEENVPIEGVPTGPRNVTWRPNVPATLVWVEALDGGDPAREVPLRDRVMILAAPFTGEPKMVARTEHRMMDLNWGEKGLALLSDYDREKRRRRTWLLDVEHAEKKPRLIWDRSVQDRYNDPGRPLSKRLPSGHQVLKQDGDDLYLVGEGASAKGNRPFLDRFNLKTLKATRLFQCDATSYETVVDLLSEDGKSFLTRHESPTSPPSYRLRTAGKDAFRALTDAKDLAPELRKITRRLVRYKRADGVPLSFTLYLPADYKEGTKLPTVVWAYPREFTDITVAGQVFGSTNRYTTIGGASHLFFLLNGYAVLDDASMPVVGSAEKANDTFIDQIVGSARAAIDKAVELGVTDRDRVGVGGHSYGAFMTANLLAHSDLFRAGIARSGAYNRTLTPFGFQRERRTLWQAPDVYMKMSPFVHAHKIKTPILLIHGEADNNPGTFPIQSERLFQAIRGNGGTVRYVTLPHESHGYAARESVEHALYEQISWFDRHVKNAPPRK
jgi:dipeptidyl aminopeptidase/acylaminoacyl peptidase